MDDAPVQHITPPSQVGDISNRELLEEMQRLRGAVEAQTKFLRDWRMPARNAAIASIAGVLTATLGVSLLVQIFQPFKNIEMLRPLIEKVSDALDQDGKK